MINKKIQSFKIEIQREPSMTPRILYLISSQSRLHIGTCMDWNKIELTLSGRDLQLSGNYLMRMIEPFLLKHEETILTLIYFTGGAVFIEFNKNAYRDDTDENLTLPEIFMAFQAMVVIYLKCLFRYIMTWRIFIGWKISVEHLSFQWGHVRTGGFLYSLAMNSLGLWAHAIFIAKMRSFHKNDWKWTEWYQKGCVI